MEGWLLVKFFFPNANTQTLAEVAICTGVDIVSSTVEINQFLQYILFYFLVLQHPLLDVWAT